MFKGDILLLDGSSDYGVPTNVCPTVLGSHFIRKHVRAMNTPLNPTFMQPKLGYAGVYLFFIFAQKHRLWVLVRTASPGAYVTSVADLDRTKKRVTQLTAEERNRP